MLYLGELAAGFGAGEAGIGRFYFAHRGAEYITVSADVGADLADGGIEGRAAEQEVGGGQTKFRAVEHTTQMLGVHLFSSLDDAHGCIVADGVAVQTILCAIVDLIL